MIGYTTFGTNDFEKARDFYDQLLSLLNAQKIMDDGRIAVWMNGAQGGIAICKPYDGQKATNGNGAMIAISAGSREMVKTLYDKALALGASDEGEPGERAGGPFYGAYFRDLDGNKFAIFSYRAIISLIGQ